MKIARSLLLALLILAAFSTTKIAAQTGTLTGSVLDPMGAVLPNSPVSIRWNDLGEPMSWNGVRAKHKKPHKKALTVFTDSAGRFSVALPQGMWDIFAYHDGLVPVCTVRAVNAGETTNVEFRFPRLAQIVVQ